MERQGSAPGVCVDRLKTLKLPVGLSPPNAAHEKVLPGFGRAVVVFKPRNILMSGDFCQAF